MKPEPMLAYALNGQPLTRDSGFPLRLIMPGWYGVANVKWLSEVHLQEDRFLGNFQARWYRTMRTVGGTGGETDPETQWVETEVTRLQLKSVIARVRQTAGAHQILGLRAERRHAAEVGRSADRRRRRGSGPRSIPPTRSIPGSCSPIAGKAPRRVSTRWSRARPTRTASCSRRPPIWRGRRRSSKTTRSSRAKCGSAEGGDQRWRYTLTRAADRSCRR